MRLLIFSPPLKSLNGIDVHPLAHVVKLLMIFSTLFRLMSEAVFLNLSKPNAKHNCGFVNEVPCIMEIHVL